jgi:hypothetical protein
MHRLYMYRLWGSPGETEIDVTPFQYLPHYLCYFLFTKKARYKIAQLLLLC